MAMIPMPEKGLEIHTASETFTVGQNGFVYFPQGRHVISAAYLATYPVMFSAGIDNDRGYAYINANATITKFTAGQSASITYTYLE